MVDVDAQRCDKLIDRAIRIVMEASGLPREAAAGLLDAADRSVKTAIVMHRRGLDCEAAKRLLERHGGAVRAALESTE